MTRVHLPLKDQVSENDIVTLARNQGWFFWRQIQRSEDAPYEVIWITEDQATRVHYVEDHIIGVRSLLVEGDDASSLARDVRNALEVYTSSEIEDLFEGAKTEADCIKATYLAAVAAQEARNTRYLRLLERAFAHPAHDVRHAAIVATGYVGWPELRSTLAELAERDPDPRVRNDAALMLAGLETHPPPGAK